MTDVLGIDEAGRGPVIGPMVLAGVLCSEDRRALLEENGFVDSKKLSASARESRRSWLEDREMEMHKISYSARRINSHSLTELTLSGITELIDRTRPDRVLFDAPGHPSSLPGFIERIKSGLNPDVRPQLVGEPGADDRYPVVSAASILAKTERDRAVENLRSEFGDLGSGYPSDPTTRAFLREHLSPDEPVRKHIRTRWSTFQDLLRSEGGPLFRETGSRTDGENG